MTDEEFYRQLDQAAAEYLDQNEDEDGYELEREQFRAGLAAEYAWTYTGLDSNGHPIKD
ncbi:MAG: hypothetical protein ACI4RK_03810 [Oscillospiraceae bacterium]